MKETKSDSLISRYDTARIRSPTLPALARSRSRSFDRLSTEGMVAKGSSGGWPSGRCALAPPRPYAPELLRVASAPPTCSPRMPLSREGRPETPVVLISAELSAVSPPPPPARC
eukprot:128862-Prorocentrum_minimum.AAC.1